MFKHILTTDYKGPALLSVGAPEAAMNAVKILLAVDGSENSLHAVEYLIEQTHRYREKPQVELVTVQLPIPKLSRLVVGKSRIRRYYKEEGTARLAEAQEELEAAWVPYRSHVLVGPIAETIAKHAVDTRCDLILIGSRGMTELGNALLGSTATKVLRLSNLPVLLVK